MMNKVLKAIVMSLLIAYSLVIIPTSASAQYYIYDTDYIIVDGPCKGMTPEDCAWDMRATHKANMQKRLDNNKALCESYLGTYSSKAQHCGNVDIRCKVNYVGLLPDSVTCHYIENSFARYKIEIEAFRKKTQRTKCKN